MTNKVIAIGNLTADCEIKQTQNGKGYATFTLAATTNNKDSEGKYTTVFYRVAVFGRLGETCATYLHKGSKALVIGDFSIREYKDTTGNDRVSYNLNADTIEFLTPKSESSGSSSGGKGPSAPAQDEAYDPDELPF